MRVVSPPRFSYRRAESVGEASAALRAEPGAIPLAGATDVVPMRNSGALAPSLLVDLKRIDELRGIEHVAAPDIRHRRGADQIDAPAPARQTVGIDREAFHVFT